MGVESGKTPQKQMEKMERLRKYFRAEDFREIYEWFEGDEGLDFSGMTDHEVQLYLKKP
jgi:hypothetical protein